MLYHLRVKGDTTPRTIESDNLVKDVLNILRLSHTNQAVVFKSFHNALNFPELYHCIIMWDHTTHLATLISNYRSHIFNPVLPCESGITWEDYQAQRVRDSWEF